MSYQFAIWATMGILYIICAYEGVIIEDISVIVFANFYLNLNSFIFLLLMTQEEYNMVLNHILKNMSVNGGTIETIPFGEKHSI